jgi:hypothetical protein
MYKSIFTLLVLLLSVPMMVSGAVWYVDKDGINGGCPGLPDNDGLSWVRPLSSISDAIRYAQPGDEIVVACGIYNENLNLSSLSDITIHGQNSDNLPILFGGTYLHTLNFLYYQDHDFIIYDPNFFVGVPPDIFAGVATVVGELRPPYDPRFISINGNYFDTSYNIKYRPFAGPRDEESTPIDSFDALLENPGSFYRSGDTLFIHVPLGGIRLSELYYYTDGTGITIDNSSNIAVSNLLVIGFTSGCQITSSSGVLLNNIQIYGCHDANSGTKTNGLGVYAYNSSDITIDSVEIGNADQLGSELQTWNFFGASGLTFRLCNNVYVVNSRVYECRNAITIKECSSITIEQSMWYDCYNHGLLCSNVDPDKRNSDVTIRWCFGGFYCQEGVRFDYTDGIYIISNTLKNILNILDYRNPDKKSTDVNIFNNLLINFTVSSDEPLVGSDWSSDYNYYVGRDINHEQIGQFEGGWRTLDWVRDAYGIEEHSMIVSVPFE